MTEHPNTNTYPMKFSLWAKGLRFELFIKLFRCMKGDLFSPMNACLCMNGDLKKESHIAKIQKVYVQFSTFLDP